ncbi:hypothetical protein E5F05_14645 [Deinococcus metallilatus]|uniref:Tetratricopeptide repeat protein n=1 Tax=Deinococcus metallilatus TaxID=1211322 RepID=A0AAJ5JXG0_9DEIO|nr:hypothetical protein [Deinococcus metallilatus]MBB5294310.1 hypothetical protein [Deinococcus metallilatus]QBY09082.1 hypothetical protein E5F05_14645 [Deinococcus metallilatus]RXJ10226.1 hypothetical protein ERJ73_13475 [Deinococcus metallilatus]TLK22518.1 hypothetical protein FCS05_17350 [Deinococcus metallilatus]GMA16353.1 hypothetical protein GCM10025871_26840 [Deinococcus metallilatus]
MRPISLLLTLALATPALAAPASANPAPATLTYGGENFRALAAESYRLAGMPGDFGTWLAQAYARSGVPLGKGGTSLTAALDARKAELAAAQGAQRDQLARDTAAWAHRFIKKAVPKFSLERGFEFASMAKTGERQCLLQSVVIAGLLQRAGLDAGLEMVWKSQSGQESNLGHVTSVLRLPSGAGDVQVDASEPEPFARHVGVLAWADGDYRFLTPVFESDGRITAYSRVDGGGRVPAGKLTFLDLPYVRSQFNYYRGERATGGWLGTGTGRSTPEGLKVSEKYLRAALQDNPHNALAANVLGNVLRKEGRDAEARSQYLAAGRLYAAQGHTPAGAEANLKWARGQAGGAHGVLGRVFGLATLPWNR